jgi:hypothetical protein
MRNTSQVAFAASILHSAFQVSGSACLLAAQSILRHTKRACAGRDCQSDLIQQTAAAWLSKHRHRFHIFWSQRDTLAHSSRPVRVVPRRGQRQPPVLRPRYCSDACVYVGAIPRVRSGLRSPSRRGRERSLSLVTRLPAPSAQRPRGRGSLVVTSTSTSSSWNSACRSGHR